MRPFVTAILILVFATVTPADAQTGGIDTRYAPDDIQRYMLDGLTSEISVAHVRFHGLYFFQDEKGLTKAELRQLAEDQLKIVAFYIDRDEMSGLRAEMTAMNLNSGFIAAFDRAWNWKNALQEMTKKQIFALRDDYAARRGNLTLHRQIVEWLELTANK